MTPLGDILVVGLGVSGVESARYVARLVSTGAARSVTAVDSGRSAVLEQRAEALRALGVAVALGADEITGRYDLAIVSPGIPPKAPVFVAAARASERVVSEVEFAYSRSGHSWVAVTGTNGKTTTTSLIAHLLNTAGVPARAVGNIGPVAVAAVDEADDGVVMVAEVSSFQLANIETFHPQVAVLLNVTPDHMNWHGSLPEYAAAKARVFENMGQSDLAIIDIDDAGSAPYAQHLAEQDIPVCRISRDSATAGGASLVGDVLTLHTRGGAISLVSEDELRIRGAHNVSNALAAAAAAHALGVSVHDIQQGLATFEPIEHRLEPVAEIAGVEWVNDSKATNPDAVLKALTAFGERPLVVMLGGQNKGNDMRPLAMAVARRAKSVVVFGEAGAEIGAAFTGLEISVTAASGLAEAVSRARELAEPGDSVVLSPACASFDEFTSYEHRGRVFKSLVAELSGGDD